MRTKLKYALPVVQMLVAWAVMDWMWLYHYLAFNSWGDTPPMWFVMMMDFPAAPVLFLPFWWSAVGRAGEWMFFALVGLLWYWVLRCVEVWRETGRPWLHAHPAVRVVEDVALMVIGFLSLVALSLDFKLQLVLEGPHEAGRFWPWSVGAVLCNMGWFVGLVFFFGRDLFFTLRCSNPKSK